MKSYAGKTWWKEAVVYQIYPRSFCDSNGDGIGDIQGILSKLTYLNNLGIDIIWISPMYQSPNDDNGYDISNYQEIMSDFGTMEDFDELLLRAHELDMKIIMDLVVNHTSDEHQWFVESKKSKDNSYRDYYIWREGEELLPPNNWGSWFGGSAWEYDTSSAMYYLHLFSKKQPDLNWENPLVRDKIFEMMTWWLDKGVDGFRMDVISLISKAEGLPDGPVGAGKYGEFAPLVMHGPHVHEYLKEMNQRVLSKYDIVTVGEATGVNIPQAYQYAGYESNELQMVFQFDHMMLEKGGYGKWSNQRFDFRELKQILTKWEVELEGKAWNSLFWSNHDQPRAVSRFGNDKEYREVSAKMLATCLHMMQGTPYIYQGEELGMTNAYLDNLDDIRDIESVNAYYEMVQEQGIEKDLAMDYIKHIGRDNARTPMQWDDTKHAGFTVGKPWIGVNDNYKIIHAKAQVGVEGSIYEYYKKLIALRHENPLIVYGSYELLEEDSEQLFVYRRILGEAQMLVVCNFTNETVAYEVPNEFAGSNSRIFIRNYEDSKEHTLRPYECKVIYTIS